MVALFITHPEVVVDPDIPVTRWRLSDKGVTRMRTFVASQMVERVHEVWASSETKAIEAAGLLAARFGLPVNVHPELGENDRASTGFLPPDEFELVANAFFATDTILHRASASGDVAIVAHGAVGTLLMCAMLARPICRDLDQPFQGHFWSFDIGTRGVVHQWRAIAPR
jgi:broad specificity phosphatase PhoE